MNDDRAAGDDRGMTADDTSRDDASAGSRSPDADDRTVRIDGTGTVTDANTSTPSGSAGDAHDEPEPEPDGFGRAGWALTIALITCTLLIPGVIYLYPYVLGRFELTFFGTYLALPMIPAVLLGAIAVWSMTAATPDDADGVDDGE
ncbi:hypothetical protein [Halopenitus sp. POP-27]|uniref:hypothetical protein n=1 Tax=Halopenitus sp. POP-27 TaxID=2994425 RepID=UPI0024699257|nr:hypothetical protein [Halopenitus sp. POP-27]